ncbi:MAG TPA: M3 family metallopeptidase [Candidatus Paceibacterota bacterium]
MKSKPQQFLDRMNKEYIKLHKVYEEYFWTSYMGDTSVNPQKDEALAARDAFRADSTYIAQIKDLLPKANKQEQSRLKLWLKFFEAYQSPQEGIELKKKIDALETKITKKRATRKEGYIDPVTQKFVKASENKMSTMTRTHPDEKIRKACFEAREKLAEDCLPEYIEMIKLRNEYARMLGFEDFYAYKVEREDGMTKKELFAIFDAIYEKTKYAFKDLRTLEKKMPNLRKPWNFGYMMTGNFTKEEDQYFPFEEAVTRWGRSFAALGIDFQGGKLQLDLLDRQGKYDNGFCHWPDMVSFENGKRKPGSSNFTCNVVMGQVGSAFQGYHTLFHEGGHAAHLLNSEQQDVCVNHEYAPMASSWAETQSMFLDTMLSSIEWLTRYAHNTQGDEYPFELFVRRVEKLGPLRPLNLNGIIFVSSFEKEIYETKNLTAEKVKNIARKAYKKYFDRSEDSLYALNVPHIYAWENSGSYHGYGLAELALEQWRDYFYKKYGYIVDNPQVGKEMKKVWALGSSKTFKECVQMATGKKLSPQAFVRVVTRSKDTIIKLAQQRIKKLNEVKVSRAAIKLNAQIAMVSGKETIATNAKSFEDMAEKYGKWLKTQVEK